ncbi:MAG: filamin [Isosphaeraceae bacterium]|jgi:hypothetical protein|nr:MAG: filamin [Isosphaeraceae bacterium]
MVLPEVRPASSIPPKGRPAWTGLNARDKPVRWPICRSLAMLAALGFGACAVSGQEEPGGDPFQRTMWPLLEQYCVDCHAEGTAEGGIALDIYADQRAAVEDGRTWLKVLDVLEGRIMPPADQRQPTLAELETMIGWIEREYLTARRDRARAVPGVVLRRLNRVEYDNTIHDLLGLDLGLAAELFPPDEISFGYDNVGSALSVSPVHVEKYLEAAERALEAAIVLPDPGEAAPIELIGLRTYPLPPDGAVEFEHRLNPGRYLVDFSLVRVGIPETVAPPRLEVGFGTDGRTLEAVRVQDETVVYRFWIEVFEGDRQVRVALAPGEAEGPSVKPVGVLSNVSGDQRYGSQVGLHVDSMVVRGPVAWDPERLPAAHRAILFREPGAGDAGRLEAARAIIERFASRAWRRPAPAEELERVLELYGEANRQGESFERSIQVALTMVLISPRFLYLIEPAGEAGDRPLDDYELASRLAYFLWAGPPDEPLLEEAGRGTLRAHLRSQVERMLADARSDRFVANFAGQWLQLRRLAVVDPDPALFPGVDAALRDAMRQETEATLAYVLRENRSILELLDADYTFVNERLAAHYGLAGVEGPEFRKVRLPDRRRGGVLTQASVLTLTSNPNRTSPVKRGQYVLQQILGTPPPPPPPDVPELPDDAQAAEQASLRERLEIHRSNPACASCHRQMDPIGFSLENYDAVGRWRETDGAFPIDPSGELAGGLAFADAAELKGLLVSQASKKFARAFVRNLMTYALGRGLEADDLPTVESIRDRLAADGYRIQTAIWAIVESPAFQNRGATGAAAMPEVSQR